MASDRPNLSRRQLLSLAGGTLGIVAAGTLRAVDLTGKSRDNAQPAAPGKQAVPVTQTTGPSAPAPAAPPKMKDEYAVAAASKEALQLLGGVQVGTTFGQWRVAAIHDFHLGAVPVVLETAKGVRYQVDVLRRDHRPQAPRGIDETRHLSFFLSNQGDGSTASNEAHGLGLMALAATVRRREPASAPHALLTLEERAARFPLGGYKVPV